MLFSVHNELTFDEVIQVDVGHRLSSSDIAAEPDLIEHVLNLSNRRMERQWTS